MSLSPRPQERRSRRRFLPKRGGSAEPFVVPGEPRRQSDEKHGSEWPTPERPKRRRLISPIKKREKEATRRIAYQPGVRLFAASALGVGVARLVAPPPIYWPVLFMIGITAWPILYKKKRVVASSLSILLSVAACSGGWAHLDWNVVSKTNVVRCVDDSLDGESICRLEAVVISAPTGKAAPPPKPSDIMPRYDRTTCLLRAERLEGEDGWIDVSGRVAFSVEGHMLGVHHGDRIQVVGNLRRPRAPRNPGEFDYARYLRGDRVFTVIQASDPGNVQLVEQGSPWGPGRIMERVRNGGQKTLRRRLDPKNVDLASAMLLGRREDLDASMKNAFRYTGTAHILAVSGLHVGILLLVALAVMRLIGLSPRTTAISLGMFVVLYAVLTGLQPPVVRAMILALIFCAALYVRRSPRPFNSLGFAALLLIIWNPANLFMVGAQLSFLAVAGMLWLGSPDGTKSEEDDEESDEKSKKAKSPKETVQSPWITFPRRASRACLPTVRFMAAIWFATLPITMHAFHVAAPIGLLLNPLLWFALVGALTSGFGVLLFGWICPPLASGVAYGCNASLDLLRVTIERSETLRWGHAFVPGPALWWIVGFYALCLLWIALFRRRMRGVYFPLIMATWIAIGLGISLYKTSHDKDRLTMTMLAVGHGQAVILETPDGRTILIDAGCFSSSERGVDLISEALWNAGIARIDTILISHGDIDHCNAVEGLAERFRIDQVVLSEDAANSWEPGAASVRITALEHELVLDIVKRGDRFVLGDSPNEEDDQFQIRVFHPGEGESYDENNAGSVVFGIEYQGVRILMPGDVEPPGLDRLLEQPIWDCDFLIAPHHGSPDSEPDKVLDWCRPECVLISGGKVDYRPAVLEPYQRGSDRLLHTHRDGAVRIEIDPEGTRIKTFGEGEWR
jgi:competence protein ComEC